MNTTIVFTLKDLLLSLFWIALIIFVVFLILILKEGFQSIRMIRKKIEEKNVEIDKIIAIAPSIAESVDKITGITAKGFQNVEKGVGIVADKMKKKAGNKNNEEDTY